MKKIKAVGTATQKFGDRKIGAEERTDADNEIPQRFGKAKDSEGENLAQSA